jgi:ABC-2 type transport system ATP-binding protein
MLEIQELTKTYRGSKKPALSSVGFAVRKGEFAALLGPNGAGKSTLIDILAGRVDPDSGRIRLDGRELPRGASALRASIGTVPQEVRFDYVFTVEEILRLEAGFYGLRRDDRHIGYLLDRLSLREKKHEKVRSLSGGMKRRLMIARALVHKPRLLLLDEPTAGVDLRLRREMYAFLRELSARGMTIVLTTHYLEEAERLCGRIILLDNGRLVADEPREKFLRMGGDLLTAEIKTSAKEMVRPFFLLDGAMEGRGDDGSLLFIYPESARESLLKAVWSAARHIESFQIRKPTLEEVFTRLTSREELVDEALA